MNTVHKCKQPYPGKPSQNMETARITAPKSAATDTPRADAPLPESLSAWAPLLATAVEFL
jgi:hypothetical protein